MQIIGKIYKGVYGCLLINWNFIRKFGGEKRCLGEIFKKIKEDGGLGLWGRGGKCGEREVVGLCG